MRQKNTVYLIKADGEEFFSPNPPGIQADDSGNLMCRVSQPLYYIPSKGAVIMAQEAIIVGPFIDILYDYDSFYLLAESDRFKSVDARGANLFIKALKELDDSVL